MDFNSGNISILRIITAVFALHLLLKRNQAARIYNQQVEREKTSLVELKEEIEHNLAFFDRIIDGSLVNLDHKINLKTHVVRKYIGNFPLTDDELVYVENSYRIFNRMNSELESITYQESLSFQSLTPLVKENRREVEAALYIVVRYWRSFDRSRLGSSG